MHSPKTPVKLLAKLVESILIGLLVGQVACGPQVSPKTSWIVSQALSGDEGDDKTTLTFPEGSEVRPGEPQHEGTDLGNCHGGSCPQGHPDNGHHEGSNDGRSEHDESKGEATKPDDFVELGDLGSSPPLSDDAPKDFTPPLRSDHSPNDMDRLHIKSKEEERKYQNELGVYLGQYQTLGQSSKEQRVQHPLSDQVTSVPNDYPYKTPATSANGISLAAAWNYQKAVSGSIRDADPKATEKRLLVDFSKASFEEADDLYGKSEVLPGDLALQIGLMALDTVVSMSPVGWTKDLYESILGKNMLTGEPLDTFDQTMAIVGIAITVGGVVLLPQGVAAIAAAGFITKIGKKAREALHVRDGIRNAGEIVVAGEGAKKFIASTRKFEVPNDKIKDFVTDLASPKRKKHILHGDATGGGHLFPGKPGKTVFPESWSGDKILHETSDIVTDPKINWIQKKGPEGEMFTHAGKPSRWEAVGIRDGVGIKVVVEPAGEGIISAFPISGPGVIINP